MSIATTAQGIADRFTTGTHALQERTSAFLKTAPPPKTISGRPLGENLLVKRVEVVQTGEIFNPNQGVSDEVVVIAVGPDVMDVTVGDHAIIRRFSGTGSEVKHEGTEYLVISQDEVLLIVEA